MNRVLITGTAGFIGSNLAKGLIDKGYSVVGVDNMSQGEKLNLAGLIGHPNFEMHYVDIRDEPAVKMAAKGCEVIVHLAAYKIPRYSDALDTLMINSIGSESVVKAGGYDSIDGAVKHVTGRVEKKWGEHHTGAKT